MSFIAATFTVGVKNHSSTYQVTEFILLGFQLSRPLEIFVFAILLLVFLLTLAGNITIIVLVCLDHRLQTPMYFFLCNLSLMEMLYVLSFTPKMLGNLVSVNKSISFQGCVAQCFLYFFSASCEIILIAMMAVDRYVAICHPLRYTLIINGGMCIKLIIACWIGPFFIDFPLVHMMSQLSFCDSNSIDHFFCDYAPLLKLSCNDVTFLLLLQVIFSALVLQLSLFVTAISYLYIIVTILRMHSTSRQKTFSTCASHIIVASIYYGSAIFMYSLPSQGRSHNVQKGVAVLTAVVTPLLNPFIYTLRNEKVKEAFRDGLRRHKSSQ